MPGPPVDPAASIGIDAYTGTDAVSGTFAGDVKPWALTRPSYGEKTQRPGEINEACWQDPAIGWGVVLSETPGRCATMRAAATSSTRPHRRGWGRSRCRSTS